MKKPLNHIYRFSQILFFWLFTIIFILSLPIILLFSLGYTYNPAMKSFVKTGVISIKTEPEGAFIYCNEQKLSSVSPHIIRNVLPQTYTILLEKEGYFSYKTAVTVPSSSVANVTVVLVPLIKTLEQVDFNFALYRFFILKGMLDEKIISFTDNGIYILNREFKPEKRISSRPVSEDEALSICGVLETKIGIVFWNTREIFSLSMPESEQNLDSFPLPVYHAQEDIRCVFLGLDERYLIIQDGKKVVAVDSEDFSVYFPIAELKTDEGEIYYDTAFEILYMHEKNPETKKITLLKKNLRSNFLSKLQSFTYERDKNKKNP